MMPRISLVVRLLAILFLTPSLARAQALGGRAAVGRPGAGGGPATANALMTALDIDGDGTLSAKEIRAATKALKLLDANRDGKLSPDELVPRPAVAGAGAGAGAGAAAGAAGAAAGRGGGAAPGGARAGAAGRGGAGGAGGFGGGGFGGRGGAGGGFGNAGGIGNMGGTGAGAGRVVGSGGKGLPLSSKQMLGFDKNRDGTLSRQELSAQLWSIYGRFDLDRNGSLDPIELRRASKASR